MALLKYSSLFSILLVGLLLFSLDFLPTAKAADIHATITTGIFVPSVPINFAATVGDKSIDFSWSPPISNGGLPITNYIIEYRLSSGGIWTVFTHATSTDSFSTVTGLSNDTAYDFRIAAVNIVGQSAFSSTLSVTPGAPAQVLIVGITDLSVPSIASAVKITNEGDEAYEYQYTWCVTDSDTNLCGGGDDIFTASAAKLIQSGEDWSTTLNSTVPHTGIFWFHLEAHFGSDVSYASHSFTAIASSPSSGGSGGGSGGGSKSKKTTQYVGGDLNNDKIVNLTDFSILMVFFGTLPPFKNPGADINGDGKVSIIDFSIMLNQWGKKPVVYQQTT